MRPGNWRPIAGWSAVGVGVALVGMGDLIFEVRPDQLEVRLHSADVQHDQMLPHDADNLLGFDPPMPPGGAPPPMAYPVVQVAGAGQGSASIAWMLAAHCMPPM